MTTRLHLFAAATALVATVAAPTLALAQPNSVVVTDDESEWNAPIFASGLSTLAVSYGAAAITAASTDTKANQKLYIPIAGPWLDLNDRTSCGLLSSCSNESTDKALLIVDGVFQAVGVLTMLDGLIVQRRHHGYVAEKKIRVLPTSYATADGGPAPGLAVLGRF